MTDHEANLKTFNDAHPLIRDRHEALRQAMAQLNSYRHLSRVGGVSMTPEMDEAAKTIRAAMDEMEHKMLEHTRLENEAIGARIRTWRNAKS